MVFVEISGGAIRIAVLALGQSLDYAILIVELENAD